MYNSSEEQMNEGTHVDSALFSDQILDPVTDVPGMHRLLKVVLRPKFALIKQ